MATFNSERLIEALKRKRFATGKLAETLEIPVDVLHKIIVSSQGDDLIVNKLNALLDEAEPEIAATEEVKSLTPKEIDELVSQKFASLETSFQNRLTGDFANWYQNMLEVMNDRIEEACRQLRKQLLTEAFCILTPAQRLKQAVEEGKLNKEQVLIAENTSPVPRSTVIEWATLKPDEAISEELNGDSSSNNPCQNTDF